MIHRIAGREGSNGYDPTDEGQLAFNAQLTFVSHLQEDVTGDLLIWDKTRLRRITLTTEAAAPKIYTVVDYTSVPNYTGGGVWLDVVYDEATSTTYYVDSARTIHRVTSQGDVPYALPGVTFAADPRITLTPQGLAILQPLARRVLTVSP